MILYNTVHMRTSDEKVHILDEAERFRSVSYSHIRPLSGLYTVVCLTEASDALASGPPQGISRINIPHFW